jgi:hypothetical protein
MYDASLALGKPTTDRRRAVDAEALLAQHAELGAQPQVAEAGRRRRRQHQRAGARALLQHQRHRQAELEQIAHAERGGQLGAGAARHRRRHPHALVALVAVDRQRIVGVGHAEAGGQRQAGQDRAPRHVEHAVGVGGPVHALDRDIGRERRLGPRAGGAAADGDAEGQADRPAGAARRQETFDGGE